MNKMNFIFVGGVPRSGTTMLQKILANHPQINAGPEFDNIQYIMSLYRNMELGIENGRQIFFYNKVFLIKQFEVFIESLFSNIHNENIKYISEKTPSNALWFYKLMEISDKYKFIFIVRDPRAIIASLKEGYIKSKKNNIYTDISRKVSNNVKLIDKYYSHLNKALEIDKERIYILYYEDILEKPEETISKLMNYFHLDYYPEMLDTSKKNIEINDIEVNPTTSIWFSKEQNLRPISNSGLDKWKKTLTKFEIKYIEQYYLHKNSPFFDRYISPKKNKYFNELQKVFFKIYKP